MKDNYKKHLSYKIKYSLDVNYRNSNQQNFIIKAIEKSKEKKG